ncbi:MAG TPA: tripartite tricarboxylate transporter TctB family protein [Usitatibacter sp.]|jgi:putative tricarboxylic transport membrane protein|nr:tripartite tricarboxylate transporter TctB family protein [Usitatibacter sp.]
MRRPGRTGDFVAGLALAALGAFIVVQARGWTYTGEDGPGPGFFPMWYGSLMVLLSLVLVVRSALATPAPGDRRVRWHEIARAAICWLAFVVCIALMGWLGFEASFALLAWFVVAVMARRPQRVALPVAIGGALAFHVVFVTLLEVNLPRGAFF